MLITSQAIVLSAIKYADYDLIVKCYTEIGIKSYLVKRIFKQKKGKITPAFFLPLTQLEITADYRNNKTLHFIKEVKIAHPYQSIPNDVIKQTMVLFLSDVLSGVLKEEEENEQLFAFIRTALIWLDTHTKTANFHLLFLLNLTKHLGCYPEFIPDSAYFDLEAGKSSQVIESKHYLTDQNLTKFISLLGTNFDGIEMLKFNKGERQELLEIIIQYFELHLPGYRKPKVIRSFKDGI